MKRWLWWFLVGVLAGCATPPSPDPWQDIEVPTERAEPPLGLPEFPSPVSVTEETVSFDLEGANAISAYIAVAEGNTDIAREHAGQIDDDRVALNALVDAGKAQRKVADLRQEILEEERRHWFWEKTSYWAGFLIIGIAVAL